MPRIHFQIQLAELKDKLLAMAALSLTAVDSAVDAYLQRDKGLCKYVKQNERAIDTAQRELDEMAYELMAKEQPMAIDLRFILAVIKINGDLERIGDQSMGIARRTKETLAMDEVDLPVDFAAMGGCVNFYVDQDNVRFEINLVALKEQHLDASSKLLSLAKIVKRP